MTRLAAVFLLLWVSDPAIGELVKTSLNGDDWTVSDSLGKLQHPLSARVPGQVHLDLMRAGVIDDPYVDWNDWLYQWIGYDTWTYSRSFDVAAEDVKKTSWLLCDGLDTAATVSVNGEVVGMAYNFHRRFKFDITNVVKEGSNSLKIVIESAANYSTKQWSDYPYELYGSGGHHYSAYFNDSNRNFVRKTQSDFGWDWGPAFVPCGIWGNISVVQFDQVYISDVVPKTSYNESSSSYFLSTTVCIDVVSKPSKSLMVHVDSMTDAEEMEVKGYFEVSSVGESCKTIWSQPISPKTVENGYLWWPQGVKWPPPPPGVMVKPNLTEVTTHVNVMSGLNTAASTVVTKHVGFRNIELVQDNVSSGGLTFFFQMKTLDQDYPFFSKGSNFIPMDAFVNRATPEVARRLLTDFVMGNQNMLRVWGGGLYQTDFFYDLCDEMGIMVWQEFMFGDALYPRDKDFLENVEAEVRDVMRRLGHHPSIVLWSGNNENQGAIGSDAMRIIDYSALYDDTVRATLWEEDTTRPYWPASPSNGAIVDDPVRKLYIQRWGNPQDSTYGDVHRYDYTHYCLDVSLFPKARFMSEFGLQSYPSFSSLKKISQPVDWSNESPFMNRRNHHPSGNKQMENLMSMIFKLPSNDDNKTQFMDFVYLSQVTQGMCIKAEAEHYRRMISTDGVLTRGTLYWQLNDIWQAPTWASVEYTGQWKVLHYYMRQVYSPISVSSYQDKDNNFIVYVVLDVINHQISYTLEVSAISYSTGKYINDIRSPTITGKGFTGVQVFNETLDKVFKGASPKEGFILLSLISQTATEILATNWHFPTNLTEVDLPDVTFTTSNFNQTKTKEGKDVITFDLSSSAVAPFVYMESTASFGVFSDNGFHMRPDMPVDISFQSFTTTDVSSFKAGLTIRTLKDTYSNKPY